MRPTGKVIGRILSVGFPLPGPAVDNYSIITAPAFFDYDALVVDPVAVVRTLAGVREGSIDAQTFGLRRVRAIPEQPDDLALDALLAQRREETRRLLERGAAIVCIAQPPVTDEYCWLPEAALDVSLLCAADGTRSHVVDATHPLAAFAIGQSANIGYRAMLRESPASAGGMRVFARSHGGAAIAGDLPALGGRIVLLPALARLPSGDARYAMSDAMQAGIRGLLGVTAEGRPPGWLAVHPVPGLSEREAAVAAAREAHETASAALAAAEAERDELSLYHSLLWQDGAVGLEPAVLQALRLIGFEVYDRQPEALELRAEGVAVLLEVEASEHPVGMAPHYRLRERIEQQIARRGTAPRGLVIVNGCRRIDPASRPQQVTDALKTAAVTMRYGISTTSALFAAVTAKLSGDEQAVGAYIQRIVTEDGLLA